MEKIAKRKTSKQEGRMMGFKTFTTRNYHFTMENAITRLLPPEPGGERRGEMAKVEERYVAGRMAICCSFHPQCLMLSDQPTGWPCPQANWELPPVSISAPEAPWIGWLRGTGPTRGAGAGCWCPGPAVALPDIQGMEMLYHHY